MKFIDTRGKARKGKKRVSPRKCATWEENGTRCPQSGGEGNNIEIEIREKKIRPYGKKIGSEICATRVADVPSTENAGEVGQEDRRRGRNGMGWRGVGVITVTVRDERCASLEDRWNAIQRRTRFV